jgi:hypothetical protein
MGRFLKVVLILGSLACGTAHASVSIAQNNSAETNNVQSQTCVLSGTVAAGDIIVVTGRLGGPGPLGTLTVSDNHNAGNYNTITGSPVSSGGTAIFDYYNWIVNTSSQTSLTTTTTITGAATRMQAACFDLNSTRGWIASPLDKSNTNNGAGATATTGTSGSITTTATDFVFASIATNAVTAETVNSPFTIQGTGGTNTFGNLNHSWGGIDNGATAGSYNCTFNWTTASLWTAIIASFTPATSGTCTPTLTLLRVGRCG